MNLQLKPGKPILDFCMCCHKIMEMPKDCSSSAERNQKSSTLLVFRGAAQVVQRKLEKNTVGIRGNVMPFVMGSMDVCNDLLTDVY